jgi:nitroreductase
MDVLEAIRNRRSVRAYDSRPIPDDVMHRLRQALRWAPSACNYQPWRFILVRDAKLRERLATAARAQMFIAQAPLIVVACGEPDRAYPTMAGHYNSLDIDLAIALDHLSLTAVAEGLGTCWIGAFDEAEAKEVLRVPAKVRVVAMMPVGYPASKDLLHPVDETLRKPESQVFATDTYASNP